MTDPAATIRAKASKFEQLITQTAIQNSGEDPPWVHSDVYLAITEDSVTTLRSSGGGSVVTYHTFNESYFDDVEVHADEEPVEAVLNVERTLEYLGVATDNERADFEFLPAENQRLVNRLEAHGALNMNVSLPASEKAFEKIPEDAPERWSEDDEFLSPSGNPHTTFITTTVQTLQKIIDAVELTDDVEHYPISVEDGEFRLDVRPEGDTEGLWGELNASSVKGEDLTNWYGPGFDPLFDGTMSGEVELQTSPAGGDGAPMGVVQEDDSKTLRHVLVQV